MTFFWLFLACWCVGGARLQYVSSGGPGTDTLLDNFDSAISYSQLPFAAYYNLPARNEFDYVNDVPITDPHTQYYENDDTPMTDLKRNRRMVDYENTGREGNWPPNVAAIADIDKTAYGPEEDKEDNGVMIQNISNVVDENARDFRLVNDFEKKNFSPWGGKRDKTNIEHMWTWKRAANIREPSMPKRVRFSPWGGKRSGQMVYKSGTKGTKFIFSTTVPELTRIVTNYSPNSKRLDLRGFQFVPSVDKRHPIKILALSTKVHDRALREALPYKSFMESLPRVFKPGHTYSDVTLKTDGKRKVKFSAWGGKRSPPIIGPIWTPAPQNVKESTLDAILVIRNNPDQTHMLTNPQQI